MLYYELVSDWLNLLRYSRKHRRSRGRNTPECPQKCLRNPTLASACRSSLSDDMRTGDIPLSTACRPGTKPYITMFSNTTLVGKIHITRTELHNSSEPHLGHVFLLKLALFF